MAQGSVKGKEREVREWDHWLATSRFIYDDVTDGARRRERAIFSTLLSPPPWTERNFEDYTPFILLLPDSNDSRVCLPRLPFIAPPT